MKKAILMILLLFVLGGCMTIPNSRFLYDNDEQIAAEGDTYTYEDRLGTVENQSVNLEFRGFYGTETVFSYTVPEDMVLNMDITVSKTVDKGRFKVVLIDPENNITELDEYQNIDMSEGKYRIKLVGEHAFGTVDINVDF
jgi:hypothetical protein